MSIDAHIQRIKKAGAIILAVDPAQGIIHARLAGGQDVPVNAFTYYPTFRWPMVGEEWILKEENGSWFLDSPFEGQRPYHEEGEPDPVIPVAPGDAIISTGTGKIWKNVSGQLEPLVTEEEQELRVTGYQEVKEAKGHKLGEYVLPGITKARFILCIFVIKEAEQFAEMIVEGNPIAITERSGSVGENYRTTLTIVLPPNTACHIKGSNSSLVAIDKLWESVS